MTRQRSSGFAFCWCLGFQRPNRGYKTTTTNVNTMTTKRWTNGVADVVISVTGRGAEEATNPP